MSMAIWILLSQHLDSKGLGHLRCRVVVLTGPEDARLITNTYFSGSIARCIRLKVMIPFSTPLPFKQRLVSPVFSPHILPFRLMMALLATRTPMICIENDARQILKHKESMNTALRNNMSQTPPSRFCTENLPTEHPRNRIVDHQDFWSTIHMIHYDSISNK